MTSISIVGVLLCTVLALGACTEQSTPTDSSSLAPVSASSSASQTSYVADPAGDVKNKAPAWLDLVSASVTRSDAFLFEWNVAAPVPPNPFSDQAVPSHSDHICLVDGIESDPTTAPAGYPFKKNSANFAEFYVALCWSPTASFGLGTEWVGFLIDRRPLLIGGQALVEPLTSSIEGTHASVVVEIAALGDPRSFTWVPFTEVAHQPDPIEAAFYPDLALDNGAFVIWPQ